MRISDELYRKTRFISFILVVLGLLANIVMNYSIRSNDLKHLNSAVKDLQKDVDTNTCKLSKVAEDVAFIKGNLKKE